MVKHLQDHQSISLLIPDLRSPASVTWSASHVTHKLQSYIRIIQSTIFFFAITPLSKFEQYCSPMCRIKFFFFKSTRFQCICPLLVHYTGRFIMFSVITNIYNKKTKGPTLMKLFTATRKPNFFLTTRDVRCVHHGWHGTHRYDTQVLATHASTWVHRYSSLLQWSVPLGQRGHVAMVGRIPGLWHMPKETITCPTVFLL